MSKTGLAEKRWEREGLTAEEYRMIVDLLDREPTETEMGMYGVMWSEHCSYKNSRPVLKKFPTEGEQVLQGPGENAGIIDIGDGQALCFKIESHNHPSAVEPYQGAATGVGGIIRDIFTMGARPIACLNSLRFGELNDEHVRYLFEGVIAGIAGYGNSIGIPTVGGEIYFSDAYQGNPLVNVMCAGILDQKDISTGTAKGVGNPVMAVGARTGRDGIQGASFASDELDENSSEDRPAVQVGDPFMEKLLLEASLELIKTGALVGIQDMGAAGLISSSSEMASRAGTGIEMDIDLLPLREEGMTPYEILLSESQERMLVVPRKGKEEVVKEIFARWGLEAAVIGRVTGDGMIRVLKQGEVVAEVPARSLADDAPIYRRESRRPAYLDELQSFKIDNLLSKSLIKNGGRDYNRELLKILASPSIASKEWVYQQYDYMVRTDTVIMPGSDAAVLRIKGTKKGIALTTDCNGRYCYLDPERGGAIAVAEAARNLVCSGARPLAVTDGLNFGNPMDPEIFWQFEKCAGGIARACRELNTPVTGGNVSFYNQNPRGAVYPTPVIGMAGLLENIEQATSQGFKDRGDIIILLGENREELGGSEYLKIIHGTEAGSIPELNLELEKGVQQACLAAIKAGYVKSAHDCSEGGLAVALAESCISGKIGAEILVEDNSSGGITEMPGLKTDNNKLTPEGLLFGETQSRIIVTAAAGDVQELEALLQEYHIPFSRLGVVGGDSLRINQLIDLETGELRQKWQECIPGLLEA